MDERRFDRLTRILGTAVDRRTGLGGLTAFFALPPSWLIGTAPGVSSVAAAEAVGKQSVQREACIPTGQRCPRRKPRGKHGKKLGCNTCCQGHVETASGVTRCACQRDGLGCSSENECCSGICQNGRCGNPPLSPPPPPPPPPTCAQACSSDCQFCLTRADAPLLCVEQLESDCSRSCTSDNDCLVPSVPTNNAYCVTSIEFRNTGEVVPPQCPTPGGKCTRADACVP